MIGYTIIIYILLYLNYYLLMLKFYLPYLSKYLYSTIFKLLQTKDDFVKDFLNNLYSTIFKLLHCGKRV